MAGTRDTPAERAKRDEHGQTQTKVEPPPGEDVVYEERPKAKRNYGRPGAGSWPKHKPGQPFNAIAASATRIILNDRKSVESVRRRRQAWQSEAWDYFDEVGEIGYTVTFMGNVMAKVRLFPAVRNPEDPNAEPISVDDDGANVDPTTAKIAWDTLERLKSTQGGQAALLHEMSVNFDVAGECYLHGHEDPETSDEDWQIRSVDELVVQGEHFALRAALGANVFERIPDDDLVVRLWERHPRFSTLATCAMRRVLGEAETVLLLSREIRATAKSRLSNGLLLMPLELSFEAPVDPTREESDGEGDEDPFTAELDRAMITPIQEEGASSAVVPVTVRGPGELLQYVRKVDLGRAFDGDIDNRIEKRVMRIARGLNMPVEVTTGLQETTFANAYQVKKSEWDSHGEPRAILMCDAITSGYFQPSLEEAGVAHEEAVAIFVWFDGSAAIASPDPTDTAEADHKDGIISDAARRRLHGHSEDDAPSDDEVLKRLLFDRLRLDPFTAQQLLRITGLASEISVALPVGGTSGDIPGDTGGGVPPAKPAGPEPTAPGTPPKAPPGQPGEPSSPPPPPPPPSEKPAEPAPAPAPAPAPTTGSAGTSTWSWTSGFSNGSVTLAPTTPGARRTDLGQALALIDRDLRTRLQVAAEKSMRRAMERAGAKVVSKLRGDTRMRRETEGVPLHLVCAKLGPDALAVKGLTVDNLTENFADLGDDFTTAVRKVQVQAHAELVRTLRRPLTTAVANDLGQRQDRNLSLATAWLQQAVQDVFARRLFDPAPGAPGPGEADPNATVPLQVVRSAMALAGGGAPAVLPRRMQPAVVADGSADAAATDAPDGSGGVAAGADVVGAAVAEGVSVEQMVWSWGSAPRTPYPPHQALDGVVFTGWDDDQLANDEGWPDNEFFFPGDHDGCCCDVVYDMVVEPGAVAYDLPDQPESIGDNPLGYDAEVVDRIKGGGWGTGAEARAQYFDELTTDAEAVVPEEERAALAERLAQLVNDADMRVRVPSDVFGDVLNDGFQNQFAAGASRGTFNPTYRMTEEAKMFGIPSLEHPSGADLVAAAGDHPIYGYLYSGAADAEKGSQTGYGDVAVTIKDSVRSRATFTMQDSLGSDQLPSWLDTPDWRTALGATPMSPSAAVTAVLNPENAALQDVTFQYAEVQFHGGLSAGDIESVHFGLFNGSASEADKVAHMQLLDGLKAQLDRLGIPWTDAADKMQAEMEKLGASPSIISISTGRPLAASGTR